MEETADVATDNSLHGQKRSLAAHGVAALLAGLAAAGAAEAALAAAHGASTSIVRMLFLVLQLHQVRVGAAAR